MKTTNERATWTVDSVHSAVGFSVRHMGVHNVRGEFETVSGTVRYDPASPETTAVDIEIPTASVHTRDARRDEHLRNADFFDSGAFPKLSFHSTRATVVGPTALDVVGNVTLRGITREVTLSIVNIAGPRRDHNGALRMGASATAKIRRADFGITFEGVGIGEEVSLSLDVSLVKNDA
jgi:polyisoprenoid-binding protein YceI